MQISSRAHLFDGMVTLTPCVIYNSTGETIPPYSFVEVVSNLDVNTDPSLLGTDLGFVAIKPTSNTPDVTVSTGAVAIPTGKNGPGYCGHLVPIDITASVGDLVGPKASSWTGRVNNEGGNPPGGWKVIAHKSGMSLCRLLTDTTVTNESTPWMKFITIAKMEQRMVLATVDLVIGDKVNPDTAGVYTRDDTVVIHDPHNRFALVEAGCTGFAYYREANSEDPSPTDEEMTPGRWEVVVCDQPFNRRVGTLRSCLLPNDPGITHVTVDFESIQPIPYTWPNVTEPVGWTTSEVTIELSTGNPFNLDAAAGSLVQIERWSQDMDHADPFELQTPREGSSLAEKWRITKVGSPHARYIVAEASDYEPFTGERGTRINITGIADSWEGVRPDADEVKVQLSMEMFCPSLEMIAAFNPEQSRCGNLVYNSVSSLSSHGPQPLDINVLDGDSGIDIDACSINYAEKNIKAFGSGSECSNPITPRAGVISTIPVEVVIDAGAGSTCGTRIAKQTINVLNCGLGAVEYYEFSDSTEAVSVSYVTTDCDGIYIAQKTVYVCASSIDGNQIIPISPCDENECTGNTIWTWDASEQEWVPESSCTGGCVAGQMPADPPLGTPNGAQVITCCESTSTPL